MLYAAKTHGDKNGFAARDIDRTINEEKEVKKMVGGKEEIQKKTWTYFKLKPFEWISYNEMLQQVKEVGSGLRELGVGENDKKSFFNIYASTSSVILGMVSVVLTRSGGTGCSLLKHVPSMLSLFRPPTTRLDRMLSLTP